MKNRNQTIGTPVRYKASRRAGPRERALIAHARKRAIRRAVLQPCSDVELTAEPQIIEECISPMGQALNQIARPLAAPENQEMSPLEATAHFADLYASVMSDVEWPWGDSYEPHYGLESLDIPDIESMWRARCQADLLGMEYHHYINAITISRVVRGFKTPTPLNELHGAAAMAICAFARNVPPEE